jgi:hypothetical protein
MKQIVTRVGAALILSWGAIHLSACGSSDSAADPGARIDLDV